MLFHSFSILLFLFFVVAVGFGISFIAQNTTLAVENVWFGHKCESTPKSNRIKMNEIFSLIGCNFDNVKKAIKSICEQLSCKRAECWLNFGFWSRWMQTRKRIPTHKKHHTVNLFVYGFQWNFIIAIDKLFPEFNFKKLLQRLNIYIQMIHYEYWTIFKWLSSSFQMNQLYSCYERFSFQRKIHVSVTTSNNNRFI